MLSPACSRLPLTWLLAASVLIRSCVNSGTPPSGQAPRTNKAEPRWVKGIWVGIFVEKPARVTPCCRRKTARPSRSRRQPGTPGKATKRELRRAAPATRLPPPHRRTYSHRWSRHGQSKEDWSPSFPSWMASSTEQPHSKAESRGRPEPWRSARPRRYSTESAEDSGTIRMVETVDAEWAEHGPNIEMEAPEADLEATSEPPNLALKSFWTTPPSWRR